MDGYIISDTLAAMMRRELKVYYQPKFDATTNRMKSAEALVRWIRDDGSVILPEQFLPSMEQTGAITMLDWYVVEEVCVFLERLKNENIKVRPVSVNFSRWHLHEENVLKRLNKIVDSHHLEHRLIVIEITESAMINEEERMQEMVSDLHRNGYEFSIDDFGSGLSSLSMVADTLPDEIKIDKSLLKKNCEDERERIILESIFIFANRLNMRTVAEGVEPDIRYAVVKDHIHQAAAIEECAGRQRILGHGANRSMTVIGRWSAIRKDPRKYCGKARWWRPGG